MANLPKLLLSLAILAFLLAIVAVFTATIMGLPPESFSRACSNLALLAIGIALAWRPAATTSP